MAEAEAEVEGSGRGTKTDRSPQSAVRSPCNKYARPTEILRPTGWDNTSDPPAGINYAPGQGVSVGGIEMIEMIEMMEWRTSSLGGSQLLAGCQIGHLSTLIRPSFLVRVLYFAFACTVQFTPSRPVVQ